MITKNNFKVYQTDVIYRSDAIKAVKKAYHEGMKDCPTYYLGIVPTVEPKQGECIYCEDDKGQDGYRCSECEFFIPWYYGYEDINFIYKYHACPSCMARMKGTDDG